MQRRQFLKGFSASTALYALPAAAQESYSIFLPSPRVLLHEDRVRLLRREVERRTPRWVQLELLLAGEARFPEPVFAFALAYLATGDAAFARKAIAAINPSTDARQLAIARDWCASALSVSERDSLVSRLKQLAAKRPESLESAPAARDITLAAVALADDEPSASAEALRWVHTTWWPHQLRKIKNGEIPVPHEEALPLAEILFSFQRGMQLDLREDAIRFFRDYPIWHLLRHYPASYPGGDNDYRVPVWSGAGEPDVPRAVDSRVAELAMVAVDTNAEASQYLQGWLLNPRFRMRSALGAPWEFLWCNPYQPSLSYFYLPLYQHLPDFHSLIARSSWEENASWFGLVDGVMQVFTLDGIKVMQRPASNGVLPIGPATIVLEGTDDDRGAWSEAQIPECERVFWLGLEPSQRYQLEIDGEELAEAETDGGGILAIDFQNRPQGAIFLRRWAS